MTIEYIRYTLPQNHCEHDIIIRSDEIEAMAREFQAIGGELGVEHFPAYDEVIVYAQLNNDDLVVKISQTQQDAVAATFDEVIRKAHELMADRRATEETV